jgi:phospholipid N-methyltransferase
MARTTAAMNTTTGTTMAMMVVVDIEPDELAVLEVGAGVGADVVKVILSAAALTVPLLRVESPLAAPYD